jgi:hypothetical protein
MARPNPMSHILGKPTPGRWLALISTTPDPLLFRDRCKTG